VGFHAAICALLSWSGPLGAVRRTMSPMAVDLTWRDAVRAACEPVFAAADVGFEWNESFAFDRENPALLWEADPARFAARYPDSEIEEGYGEQWPPPCIDYWVYVDPVEMTARLSTEGWSGLNEAVSLTGDGSQDGHVMAARFGAILRVVPPAET
jgi:hypothetical protein